MRHRLLTGLAVAPLTLAALCAGPAHAASTHPVALAAQVSEPEKQAADSVGTLAGGLVAAASAAFAGTAMMRRRKG
ncbi:hypothetical protein [Catenulispora rubra]|uniref:hypothetical protein n=1 Tax=Catenulispora rubra TaxID=280293 RepID=UPI0018920538|nr:hypothetical protein [Catenulispora rubra]